MYLALPCPAVPSTSAYIALNCAPFLCVWHVVRILHNASDKSHTHLRQMLSQSRSQHFHTFSDISKIIKFRKFVECFEPCPSLSSCAFPKCLHSSQLCTSALCLTRCQNTSQCIWHISNSPPSDAATIKVSTLLDLDEYGVPSLGEFMKTIRLKRFGWIAAISNKILTLKKC